MQDLRLFWQQNAADLFSRVQSSPSGLPEQEADKRLVLQRKQQKIAKPYAEDLTLLLRQFKSPLVLLLVFAVIVSIVLHEYSDSFIILTVLLGTGLLGFIQERKAGKAVKKLQELVHSKALVRRGGKEYEIKVDDVVQGDIVLLNAGDVVPADSYILKANDLHVNESMLTGESFPVEKFAKPSFESLISKASNAVFKGTSIINGTATVLAINTELNSELGKIATSLQKIEINAFERGIIRFGYLLMRLTITLMGIILVLNIVLHRPFIESLLFSLALTVGLTPELLPAILTITLAAGAKRMAAKKVIVKKLDAIQNLGQATILCSDKTGTITEGLVKLTCAINYKGIESPRVRLYAYLNASYETGFNNPIDEAIRALEGIEMTGYSKCDEVPYDFIRKRLSIVVSTGNRHLMITKGAVTNILEVCSGAEIDTGEKMDWSSVKSKVLEQFRQLSYEGSRVIGLAYKDVTGDPVINKDDEKDMTFLGLLIFTDPLKAGIIESIQKLEQKGLSFRLITGDNVNVAKYIAAEVHLRTDEVLTGTDLANLTSDTLARKMEKIDVFAEILPDQKERIVKALQKAGHTVGYMGDGINDANALKAADVGISINNAVDVAKEAADIVLLEQNVNVITDGVIEGRKTFTNTQKYIFITTSANFGNMLSMAIASLLLPFFPLLPVQILLNNFLSDLPSMTIASDKVDDELIVKPTRWDLKYILRFMVVFGLLSSFFDFTTFGLLLYVFHASQELFRTAWFMESLMTEILVLLVVRTRRPFFKSMPSKYLFTAAILTFCLALTLPYLPFNTSFRLYPLPVAIFLSMIGVTLLYVIVAEISKRYLVKHFT